MLYRYLKDEPENNEDVEVSPSIFFHHFLTNNTLGLHEACIAHVSGLFPERPHGAEKKKKKKKVAEQRTNDSDDEPVDALVDTLIGYLEKSTAYLRAIANQVFSQVTELVNKSTIDLILTVRFSFLLEGDLSMTTFHIAIRTTRSDKRGSRRRHFASRRGHGRRRRRRLGLRKFWI